MNDLSSSPTSDFRCMQYFNMNDENQDPDRSKHFNYLTKYEVGLPFSDHTNILYDSEYNNDHEWETFDDNQDSIKEKMPILESINYISDFEETNELEEDHKLTQAHLNANSLCNVIALPRTFRWMMCEWFYSNLDRPLLLGKNDFQSCLDIRFPYLKTRRLTRGQWLAVKRLIGKPRRSSPKFFNQERKALSEKRQKLRTMERLVSIAASSGDVSLLNMSMHQDLLENLPIDFKLSPRLSPGTAVIVRIYQPNPGIFKGIVQEESKVYPNYGIFIDSMILMVPSHDSASQSEFENSWYGYCVIPDTDVIGIKPPDNLISVADLHAGSTLSDAILSLTEEGKHLIASGQTSVDLRNYYKHTRNIIADQLKSKSNNMITADRLSPQNKDEESLDFSRSKIVPFQSTSQLSNSISSQSSNIMFSPKQNSATLPYNYPILSREDSVKNYSSSDEISAYPMDFLHNIVKLSRLINLKTTFVKKLKSLNDEAEEILSEQSQISLEFQHNYATLIVQLDNLKKEITQHFTSIFKHTEEEQPAPQLDQAMEWHRKCDEEAAEIIIKSQEIQGHPLINAGNFDLISKLMRLLLQIRNLTDTRPGFSEVQSIHNEMKEIKSMISECNIEIFDSDIEQKVNQILSSINQYVTTVNYNPSSSHQHQLS